MAVAYQISACGTRPRAEKFLASSENVANVEMLPVPMLPMANGAGLRARRPAEDLRAWKPATPNEARHPE